MGKDNDSVSDVFITFTNTSSVIKSHLNLGFDIRLKVALIFHQIHHSSVFGGHLLAGRLDEGTSGLAVTQRRAKVRPATFGLNTLTADVWAPGGDIG